MLALQFDFRMPSDLLIYVDVFIVIMGSSCHQMGQHALHFEHRDTEIH